MEMKMEITAEIKPKVENDIVMLDEQEKEVFNNEEKLQENICPNLKEVQKTTSTSTTTTNTCLTAKDSQFDTFQNWAVHNYGDNSKTKTVTVKKYNRIRDILNGEETPSSDNAKFRFWVKAKGFKLGPSTWRNGVVDSKQVLYVPTKVQTAHGVVKEFKRVAKVDDFFDIIYSMHVDPECRGGKHAGQKRTYRAIAETYAFLPREAVTRFLMSCQDCQKRMHLSPDHPSHALLSPSTSPSPLINHESEEGNSTGSDFDTSMLNYNVPITTTYLNHIKKKIQRKKSIRVAVDLNNDETQIGMLGKCPTLPSRSEDHPLGLNLSKTRDFDNERKTSNEIADDSSITTPNEHLKQCLASEKLVDYKQEYSPKMKSSKVGKALSSFLGRKYKSGLESPTESSTSLRPSNLYKPYEVVPNSNDSTSQSHAQRKHHSPLPGTIPTIDNTHSPNYNSVAFPGDVDSAINLTNGNNWAKNMAPENLLYLHPFAAQMGYAVPQKPNIVSALNGCPEEATNLSTRKPVRCEPVYNCQQQYISDSQSQAANDHQSQVKLLTIRQLILGYRESAAFLYRSAQELEQLLVKYS